jgi:hypothetical protein
VVSHGPRNPHLDFAVTRRAFFRALLLEARQATASIRGRPAFSLAALQDLPRERLARLVPELQPGWALHVEGERLVARGRETGTVLDLAPATKENVLALNLLDGQRTIGSASRRLARDMGWPEEEAMEHMRQFFFVLAGAMVCLPRNAGDLEA